MQGKTGKNELCVYIEAHKPTSMSTLENYPAPGLLYVNWFMIIWLNKSAIKYMLHVSIVSSEELKLDFDTEPHNKRCTCRSHMWTISVITLHYYTTLQCCILSNNQITTHTDNMKPLGPQTCLALTHYNWLVFKYPFFLPRTLLKSTH